MKLLLLLFVVVLAFATPLLAQDLVEAPTTAHPLALQVIAIAGVIFTVIGTIKKILHQFEIQVPAYVSLVLNVVLSAVGVLVVAPPETIFTWAFLIPFLGAILTAAGFHDLGNLLKRASAGGGGGS